MMNNIQFYIGYDSTMPEISKVCYSSMSRWIEPENLHLLKLSEIENVFKRPRDPKQATEFSFTRFLIPYLMNYKGFAVFCDGDFLWVNDPKSIREHLDPNLAVHCVQHNIQDDQLTSIKMDNRVQIWYPRKNWSSMMVINCEHPLVQKLTPEVVNTAPAGYLHQLEWAENSIGSLPLAYNFLVGYYLPQGDVCAYHYTDGIPLHTGYENCEYSDLWMQEYQRST